MKIYYQESNNDCGISVTRSLIQHFFKKEITRTEIFNQVNITEEGLCIFELEAINKKYGIHLETYQTTIEELVNLSIKNFFILIILRDNKEHFVIAKKFLKNFILYDSSVGKVKISPRELNQIFSGKILLIEKVEDWKVKNLKTTTKEKEIFILNFPKLSISIFLELLTFIFLLISFAINKSIFEDVIQSNHWGNIGVIILWAGLLIFIWSLNEYLKDIFYLKNKQWYYKKLYQLLFEKLENKKNYFFSKLSKNQFLMTYQYINNLSSFYSETISLLISSLLISSFLIFYLLYLNLWIFFLVILIFLVVKIANFYWARRIDNQKLPEIWRNNLNIQKLFFTLNHFCKNEWNYDKFLFLNKSLKNEILQHNLINREMNSNKIIISKLNFFITYLLNIAIYIIGCNFYFQKNIDITNIIMAGIIFHQLNGSLDKFISASFSWNIYNSSLQNLKQLIFNDNIQEDNNLRIPLPSCITIKNLDYHNGIKDIFTNLNLTIFHNTFLFGSSGIGKSTLYKLISSKLNHPENSIFFDHIEISNISQKFFNQLVIYQNNQTTSEEFQWEKLYEYLDSKSLDSVLELTRKLDISIGKNIKQQKFSNGQRQFINLLNLLTYSGKVILLDEVTSHINKEIKQKVYEIIFPILHKRNFVICCEHDKSLKEFFKHHINLDQLLNK